jgi:ornithine cyclodeaminase/alanine dehydrogenase-like protein (mu-crystallin family)
MTLILSNDDVEALLPMSECIRTLEEAYRELAHERAVNALRTDAVSTTSTPDAVYGLQFAAAGAALYRQAREAGRGRELPTEWFTEDVVP